jgi:Zn-dependent peptidase ImmA (M78 family)
VTKLALARASGVSVRGITAYERGETTPSEVAKTALSDALRFPESFFEKPAIALPSEFDASFRALSSMTASQRHVALAAGALAFELSDWIESRFVLPAQALPDLGDHEPEEAAEVLRLHWDLGAAPVRNMVHVLEANGVRVFSLAEECRALDAFSLWRAATPFVFLNTIKSAERSRYDAAHELGHLVLHRNGKANERDAERDANAFASAFLMPRASVLASIHNAASIETLIRLKHNWGVSVGALARRLRDLGLVSDWIYHTLCVAISQRGYRTTEPDPMVRESSQVLDKVFLALRRRGVGRAAIAKELDLYPEDLDAIVFGLMMTGIPGGRDPNRREQRRRLRTV